MRVDAIRQLREQVSGPVLTAGDAGYDDARAVHNGMFDRFPRVIVRAEQVSDVVDAVNFARESGIELSVKGGGHSALGFGVNDDGLVIDLSLLHGVQVDPQGGRAALAGAPRGASSTRPRIRTVWPPRAASSLLPASAALPSAAVSVTWPGRTACRSTTCSRPRSSPPTVG